MFRSRFNRVIAIAVWAVCLVTAAANVAAGAGTAQGIDWRVAPGIGLVAIFAWLALWHPSVSVSDAGVRLVNVLSTVTVPWPALVNLDTRFALTLVTPKRSYSATAAPAPSRIGFVGSRRDAANVFDPSRVEDGQFRASDLVTTDSGGAAYLVNREWSRRIEAGTIELGIADSTPVTREWHWVAIGILLALIALSLLV